jgi:hypothetical protein
VEEKLSDARYNGFARENKGREEGEKKSNHEK